MKNALIALMVAPALGLLLAPVQPVFAQGGADSLYDIAPGQTPPDRDRDLDREFDGDATDDDPEIEEMLRRLDRAGSPDRGEPDLPGRDNRNDWEDREPEIYERDEPDRDLDRPPPRDRDERRRPGYEEAKADLGHKVIAGIWTGTVEEVGQDPYKVRLSLGEDGRGTAVYSNLGCTSDVFPIAGRLLEFSETITKGRDACADGIFRLRLHRGMLLWSWKDDDNSEFRAAATLRRTKEKAGGGDALVNDADTHDTAAEKTKTKAANAKGGGKPVSDTSSKIIQDAPPGQQAAD